jgi:hypothetical protein
MIMKFDGKVVFFLGANFIVLAVVVMRQILFHKLQGTMLMMSKP